MHVQVFGVLIREGETLENQGLLQPFPIPEWKWKEITMDLVTTFLQTPNGMPYGL